MVRSVVVFPQPDGPRKVSNSPGLTSSDTPSTAVSGPNSFVTPDSDNTGSGDASVADSVAPACDSFASAGDSLASPADCVGLTDCV